MSGRNPHVNTVVGIHILYLPGMWLGSPEFLATVHGSVLHSVKSEDSCMGSSDRAGCLFLVSTLTQLVPDESLALRSPSS